ncbi:MAG: nitroreductase [Gammaproteobacteria bacterium]|jgi:nitroreductase
MSVKAALLGRKSTRAFLDKEVSRKTIHDILDVARHAPSGANTQPWQVAIVTGARKQQLQERLEQEFRRGVKGKMDYEYYPTEWKSPYKDRRVATGLQLYKTLGIKKEDTQRRADQWAANYRAFDAPVMLLFFMDAGLQTGSFMDYGMFIQSVMLAAVDEGLATCPQAALGEYPEIVKDTLGYPLDSILLCGMSLGYEDTNAAVNSYRTPREEVDSFTRYFE